MYKEANEVGVANGAVNEADEVENGAQEGVADEILEDEVDNEADGVVNEADEVENGAQKEAAHEANQIMAEASEGELTAGAAAVLTTAKDPEYLTQERAEEAESFSADGLVRTNDEGEDDAYGATLGRTGSAIEVVVPIELIEEINPTETFLSEMSALRIVPGVVLYGGRTGAWMSMSWISHA